jgi:hypothetical protein
MKRFTAAALSLVIVMAFSASVLFAQDTNDDRKAQRDRIATKVEELRKEILISKVGLTEAEVTKLTSINKEKRENSRALSKALREEPVNESDLKSILNKRSSLQKEMTSLRTQEEKEISKMLSTEEFARYIVFNERFNRQIRGLVAGGSYDRGKRDRTKK